MRYLFLPSPYPLSQLLPLFKQCMVQFFLIPDLNSDIDSLLLLNPYHSFVSDKSVIFEPHFEPHFGLDENGCLPMLLLRLRLFDILSVPKGQKNSPSLSETEKNRLSMTGGTTQNRTGDKGFAVLCLTAWLWCRGNGAEDGVRTRYLRLGKAALYHMSYSRELVPQSGIEPPTQGFSVPCSTD